MLRSALGVFCGLQYTSGSTTPMASSTSAMLHRMMRICRSSLMNANHPVRRRVAKSHQGQPTLASRNIAAVSQEAARTRPTPSIQCKPRPSDQIVTRLPKYTATHCPAVGARLVPEDASTSDENRPSPLPMRIGATSSDRIIVAIQRYPNHSGRPSNVSVSKVRKRVTPHASTASPIASRPGLICQRIEGSSSVLGSVSTTKGLVVTAHPAAHTPRSRRSPRTGRRCRRPR